MDKDLAKFTEAILRSYETGDPSTERTSRRNALHSRDYRDCLTRMARYKQFCSPELMQITEAKKMKP